MVFQSSEVESTNMCVQMLGVKVKVYLKRPEKTQQGICAWLLPRLQPSGTLCSFKDPQVLWPALPGRVRNQAEARREPGFLSGSSRALEWAASERKISPAHPSGLTTFTREGRILFLDFSDVESDTVHALCFKWDVQWCSIRCKALCREPCCNFNVLHKQRLVWSVVVRRGTNRGTSDEEKHQRGPTERLEKQTADRRRAERVMGADGEEKKERKKKNEKKNEVPPSIRDTGRQKTSADVCALTSIMSDTSWM